MICARKIYSLKLFVSGKRIIAIKLIIPPIMAMESMDKGRLPNIHTESGTTIEAIPPPIPLPNIYDIPGSVDLILLEFCVFDPKILFHEWRMSILS